MQTDIGQRVSIEFIERFQLEQSTNCTKDYVEIIDYKNEAWVSLGRKCGREIEKTINSTGNKIKILFRSDNDSNGFGFKVCRI